MRRRYRSSRRWKMMSAMAQTTDEIRRSQQRRRSQSARPQIEWTSMTSKLLRRGARAKAKWLKWHTPLRVRVCELLFESHSEPPTKCADRASVKREPESARCVRPTRCRSSQRRSARARTIRATSISGTISPKSQIAAVRPECLLHYPICNLQSHIFSDL